MTRPTLSLILPVFNEEEVIPLLHQRLQEFLGKLGLDCEVIFIDDGSNDHSVELLKGFAVHDPRYRILSFSRNFGHQSAITAGVDYARGAAVVVMDADLQDPPDVVLEMVDKWREGFDVVYGKRLTRVGESYVKLITARWFYRIFKMMIPIEVPLDTGDFRLMSRRVIVALRALRESHRFVRGMVAWIGFRQTEVLYDRPARAAGDTKYPLRKMIRFAVDGITSFSVLPLRLATYLGMFISVVSVIVAIWAVVAHFFFSATVPGWTATVVLVALLASVQLLMTGILGEYIGRIYEQVKHRPMYVVGERVNAAAERDTDEMDEGALPPPRPPIAAPAFAQPAFLGQPPPAPPLGRAPVSHTLMGVAAHPPPHMQAPPPPHSPPPHVPAAHVEALPPAFPAVPALSTVIMPLTPSKEGLELAKASDAAPPPRAPSKAKTLSSTPPPPPVPPSSRPSPPKAPSSMNTAPMKTIVKPEKPEKK